MPPRDARLACGQAERNAERIGRMHDELAAILGGGRRRGLEVDAPQGRVLTTMPGEPTRSAARWPTWTCSSDPPIGRRRRRSSSSSASGTSRSTPPRPTHDIFVDPGDGRVVDPDGEHPDNPRRVDLHTEVKRHLWGWVDDDDLTAYLWDGATRGQSSGEPATLPATAALLAHLAIHASSDLLVGRGRLVQWLDLGVVARGRAGPLDACRIRGSPIQSLRLAARAQPTDDGRRGPRHAGAEGCRRRWRAGRRRCRRRSLWPSTAAAGPSRRHRRALGALASGSLAARGRVRRPPLPVGLARHGGTSPGDVSAA